jgi:hypothetical protein
LRQPTTRHRPSTILHRNTTRRHQSIIRQHPSATAHPRPTIHHPDTTHRQPIDHLAGNSVIGGEQESMFFFEKKNQKTFVSLADWLYPQESPTQSKSFLVLFFKKEHAFFFFEWLA